MTINYFSSRPALPKCDVCIIGAGPLGLAVAVGCAAGGLSVLVVESGQLQPNSRTCALSDALIVDPRVHASMEIATCRALGGTTHYWGGRCVPYDDVDFSKDRNWPFGRDELARWYGPAAEFLQCGRAEFSIQSAKFPNRFEAVRTDTLERWASRSDLSAVYRDDLAKSKHIFVLLGATVTQLGIPQPGNEITEVTLTDAQGSQTLRVRTCVIACGGLESTRLLLHAQRARPDLLAVSKMLGRTYMGHISGKIADIVLHDPTVAKEFDFQLDEGTYVRRRFTFDDSLMDNLGIKNIAFWIDNPPFYDASHKSGALSAIWLTLSNRAIGQRLMSEAVRVAHLGPRPYDRLEHFRNVLKSPLKTARVLSAILRQRYVASPPKPGFIVSNTRGRYSLHYHSEHSPACASHVCLDHVADAFGLNRLRIDIKFGTEDAASVVRAHEQLDRALRKHALGYLDYKARPGELVHRVLEQSADGFHQIGTTRMGTVESNSVVDQNCRVHQVKNLFVASTSVFPSSSQANPTFVGVAIAFRLANFLCAQSSGERETIWGRAT